MNFRKFKNIYDIFMSSTLPWQMSFVIYNEHITNLLTKHEKYISWNSNVVIMYNINNQKQYHHTN